MFSEMVLERNEACVVELPESQYRHSWVEDLPLPSRDRSANCVVANDQAETTRYRDQTELRDQMGLPDRDHDPQVADQHLGL